MEEDPQEALARAVWRTQAEYEGPLRVLTWGGLGYTQVGGFLASMKEFSSDVPHSCCRGIP